MKKLKKMILGISMVMAILIISAPAVLADSIAAGDWVKLYKTWGTTGGGPFDLYRLVDGSYIPAGITFCLEINEYMHSGSPAYVADVSKQATNGGTGGGSPDPLDTRTAYLYYQYMMGNLNELSGGVFTNSDAGVDALQEAIWFLEDEAPLGKNNYLVAVANGASADALSWAYANVWILNLTDGNKQNVQDQLVMIPVPEPASLLLLGLGLVGLGLSSRRFKR